MGVMEFLEYVRENDNNSTGLYPCPCKKCFNMGQRVTLDEIYIHLTNVGIMESYTVWNLHGEISETPSQWQVQLQAEHNRSSSSNPTMDFVQDAFPFRESYDHLVLTMHFIPTLLPKKI